MARRYRYAFAKKKEAQKGKLSTGLAAASLILFITAVLLAFFMNGEFGYIVGGVSLVQCFCPYTGSLWDLRAFRKKTEPTGPV